jgi:uncharacterized protein DUF4158
MLSATALFPCGWRHSKRGDGACRYCFKPKEQCKAVTGTEFRDTIPATCRHPAVPEHLTFYGKKNRLVAVRAAQEAALIVQQRVDLVNAIIDELVRQQYELPAYSTLENIADVVASAGESKLISLVDSRLSDRERAALDALLAGQAGSQRSPFDRIKQSPRRLSRSNMEALIDQLTWLEGLGDVDRPLAGLATQKVRYLASHAMTLDASDLKDLSSSKRYALMLAAILRLRSRVRDDIAEMLWQRSISGPRKSSSPSFWGSVPEAKRSSPNWRMCSQSWPRICRTQSWDTGSDNG